MTAMKWSLLAVWAVASYILSFLVAVVLDDRKMLPFSWYAAAWVVYAPLIWLNEESVLFETLVNGIVKLSHDL